ncbi:MAG: hypothetical protein AAGA05_03915 [Pseudomonadota bacterium]
MVRAIALVEPVIVATEAVHGLVIAALLSVVDTKDYVSAHGPEAT